MAVAMCACNDPAPPEHVPVSMQHSSSMALDAAGNTLYVVNPDADSVSVIDTVARTLVAEIPLGDAPAVDADGNYAPEVMPRALALSPDETTLYVTGQRSGNLYAVDVASRAVRSVRVGSEPLGVVVSADGSAIYVAVTQDDLVMRFDPTLQVIASATVPAQPWALAMWPSEAAVVATGFMGGGVTMLDPDTLDVRTTTVIPDTASRGDARLAHGSVRGLYDVVPRPIADELWVPHILLGVDTAQPELDFERTVFPSVSVVHTGDTYEQTLSIDAADVPGVDGAFADIVSGPHAIAFSPQGDVAYVVDTSSEDVLVVDATSCVETGLVRPLPGHMPEGIAVSPDGSFAYVDERNTADIAVIDLASLRVDGAPIARLAADPMPADLREGQHLFYSANSDELPITRNHWVACSSCHLEGRSDGVTWRFEQGPRDTPTNAGGMLGTGFLFRTADRTEVQDYWHTIQLEQGGSFDATADADLLNALERYVDHSIPFPQPPTTNGTLVARGKALFEDPTVGCLDCHSGPRFTDSGAGNATLDLKGTVVLHDVGTCVALGDFPDVAHEDVDGNAREACKFDTPSLRGIAASPPYLHDGSAPTIRAVLDRTRSTMGNTTALSDDDLDALAEYVRSL